MKSRYLNQILENPGYYMGDYGTYIAVGSTLCHDLIKVEKSTLKLSYALDTWKQGRECLVNKGNEKLLFIWDKLQQLIDSGEIEDIISGQDIIENPLPVYTIVAGELISTFTDAYGWPNCTIDGIVMHDNTYFENPEAAYKYGINEYNAEVEIYDRQLKDLKNSLIKKKESRASALKFKNKLIKELKKINTTLK